MSAKEKQKVSRYPDFHMLHVALHDGCSNVSKQWFDDALEYLKKTNDANGWGIMIWGC